MFIAELADLFFLFATIFKLKILLTINNFYFKFGLLLGKLINPIVLGLIFFLLITPLSLLLRIFGRDTLNLKKQNVQSYWINRSPPGPGPETFKNQF